MPVQEWCPGDGVAGHVLRGLAVPGGWGGVGVGVTGPPTAWRHYSVIMGGWGSGSRCKPSSVWTENGRVSMIAWAWVEIAQ